MSPCSRLALLLPLLIGLLSTGPAAAAASDSAAPANPPVLQPGVVTQVALGPAGSRAFTLPGSGGWVSLELAAGDVTLRLQGAANTVSLQQSTQGPATGWLGLSGPDSGSTYRLRLASQGGAQLAVTFFAQPSGDWAQPASEVTSSAYSSSSGSSASSSVSRSTSISSSGVVTVG